RFLQEGELRSVGSDRSVSVKVRIVAATHRDLGEHVAQGTFREDLYFRLRVLVLSVPALRERRSDIPMLAEFFLREAASRAGRSLRGFEKSALRALVTRDWPGNVRQLQHLVQRSAVFADGPLVSLGDLGLSSGEAESGFTWPGELLDRPFGEARDSVVQEFEHAYVKEALGRADGNVAEAARLAGVPRKSFWRIAQRVGLAADRASRKAGNLKSTNAEVTPVADPLAAARAAYLERSRGTAAEVTQRVGAALDLEGWSWLKSTAHRLRGSGGTYGLPQISEAAGALENAASVLDVQAARAAAVELARSVE
ncbi:MAG: sigma 54-interacting transcriptional regulator, partial [Deltaproteobacteria bacterium]|nr:sigma 54-interacting transcriptional regulator [Deltaproteobacteria bacterium]